MLKRASSTRMASGSAASAIMPMILVPNRMRLSSSARRFLGAGLFPVDKQEPAGCVELRLARSGQDLELQLFELVLGAIPAGEREISVAPGAGQQHHMYHGVVGHERAVLVEMPERPQRHGTVDRGHEWRVDGCVAVVVEPEDHAAEAGVVRHV